MQMRGQGPGTRQTGIRIRLKCTTLTTLGVAVTNALFCFTSPADDRPVSPTTTPVTFRKKARSSRAATEPCRISARFHLRHGDGRYAPASSDLRLRSTFPFAEPQAEAKKIHSCKKQFH